MCKEVDDSTLFSESSSSGSKTSKNENIPIEESSSIDDLNHKIIPLPEHSCGVKGDPLHIETREKFVDLELSEV